VANSQNHAAIGVRYNPRQCFCQRYEAKLSSDLGPPDSGSRPANPACWIPAACQRPASSGSPCQCRPASLRSRLPGDTRPGGVRPRRQLDSVQAASSVKNVNKAKKIKSRGEQTIRQAPYRMSGVDATAIDAIGVGTVQVILGEYGPESRFATEKQFVQHATLAPHQPTGGGKALKKKKRGSAVPVLPALCAWRRHRWNTAQQHSGLTTARQRDAREERGGICHGQEVGNTGLPPATVGATIH